MELVEQQPGSPDAWDEAFMSFHARFASFFYRREVRERSARYLRGLLGPVERKNGWQVAEAVREADPQGIQRLLRVARWDADAVRDELIRFVAEQFGDADGIFVVDETGFVKKGIKSVGVQRQYTGTVGKTENCQVGVFLTYVGPQGHAFLDRRLYLPEGWAEDRTRRAGGGRPGGGGLPDQAGVGVGDARACLDAGDPGALGDRRHGLRPRPAAPRAAG